MTVVQPFSSWVVVMVRTPSLLVATDRPPLERLEAETLTELWVEPVEPVEVVEAEARPPCWLALASRSESWGIERSSVRVPSEAIRMMRQRSGSCGVGGREVELPNSQTVSGTASAAFIIRISESGSPGLSARVRKDVYLLRTRARRGGRRLAGGGGRVAIDVGAGAVATRLAVGINGR